MKPAFFVEFYQIIANKLQKKANINRNKNTIQKKYCIFKVSI